jgi:hypothetical protein
MQHKRGVFIVLVLCGLAMSLVYTGLVLAQEGQPVFPEDSSAPEASDASSPYIPVQGRLTDAEGRPLDGFYGLTFRLYDSSTAATPLCGYGRIVEVRDGYFDAYFPGTGCSIDGRTLYLGIQVDGDEEMAPRRQIQNVVYAWTLHPGAVISDTLGSNAILHLENWAENGRGLRSYAMSQSGVNYAVVGASRSPAGYAGYFYNNGGGVGLWASTSSAGSPAILADGVDSGPDLILGGNADTGAGDEGILTSDPAYTSSDLYFKSNDNVRIDLDNDGDGEDADFEIRNKDDILLFDVDESGAVVSGGPGIAAFPRPAYDSGWVTIAAGNTIDLIHSLGGNVDNYVVDLSFKHASYGTHTFGYGADVTSGYFYGAFYRNLTTSAITIERADDDLHCSQMRVRIWMYP